MQGNGPPDEAVAEACEFECGVRYLRERFIS